MQTLIRSRGGQLLQQPSNLLLTLCRRGLQSSSGNSEPAAPKPVALSKLKDSFNDATSGQ